MCGACARQVLLGVVLATHCASYLSCWLLILLEPAVCAQVSATMQIPLSYAEAIIGAAGNNINFLRKTSGAAVTVTESVASGGQLEMTVEVRGSAPQVHTAQQLIEVSCCLGASLHMKTFREAACGGPHIRGALHWLHFSAKRCCFWEAVAHTVADGSTGPGGGSARVDPRQSAGMLLLSLWVLLHCPHGPLAGAPGALHLAGLVLLLCLQGFMNSFNEYPSSAAPGHTGSEPGRGGAYEPGRGGAYEAGRAGGSEQSETPAFHGNVGYGAYPSGSGAVFRGF